MISAESRRSLGASSVISVPRRRSVCYYSVVSVDSVGLGGGVGGLGGVSVMRRFSLGGLGDASAPPRRVTYIFFFPQSVTTRFILGALG